jgi:DNA repair ATPase RecN
MISFDLHMGSLEYLRRKEEGAVAPPLATGGFDMSHHKIRSLKITGGFLDGLDVQFADGLVCFIGPRGSGKTTIQELIRFALDMPPAESGSGSGRSQKRFDTLIGTNLGNGLVEVAFETRDGSVYLVQRSNGDKPIVRDEDGDPVSLDILRNRIQIDAAIFSQNEIEDIAMQPGYLRAVLDRFCSADLADAQHQLRQARTELQRNASGIVQLMQKAEKTKEAVRQLPELDKRLAVITEELKKANLGDGVDKASKQKTMRTKESEGLARVKPVLAEARSALAPLRAEIIGEFKQVFTQEIQGSPNWGIFQGLKDKLRDGVVRFQQAIKDAEEALQAMVKAGQEAEQALAGAHQPQEAAYQEMLKKSKEYQSRLRERDNLTKQVAKLKAENTESEQIGKRLAAAQEERGKALQRYSDLCEKRYRIRARVAESLTRRLNNSISVAVGQDAEYAGYRDFLVENRSRTMFRYTAELERVAKNVHPMRLAALVGSRDPEGVEELADLAGIDQEYSASLLEALAGNPELRFRLEALELDDVPRIELLVGGQPKPSDQLSTGQMCAVVLPLLLLESVAPLLIDQPEDNLDNRFVTESVVDLIEKTRETRQMLFITHNPNIPVLGRASQVIVMDSDGTRGWVDASGDVDEMREHIVDHLEGGEQAFKIRKKQYGW